MMPRFKTYSVVDSDTNLAQLVDPGDTPIALSFLSNGSLSKSSVRDQSLYDRLVEVNIGARSAIEDLQFMGSFRNLESLTIQKDLKDYSGVEALAKVRRVSVGRKFSDWQKFNQSPLAHVAKRHPVREDLEFWGRETPLKKSV